MQGCGQMKPATPVITTVLITLTLRRRSHDQIPFSLRRQLEMTEVTRVIGGAGIKPTNCILLPAMVECELHAFVCAAG
jgi:hypothetical protein